jgi:U32 family peptidase
VKTAGRSPRMPDRKPELLAPAGDWDALRAAVSQGADAVYLGAGAFNARRKAANFTDEQLQEAIDFAHLAGVRVYLTLNTLIADEEGTDALELAAKAYAAGADALIVQDIGLTAVLRQALPDMPLFASTQMTIGDEASIRAAARVGINRIILPRELSLPEISRFTRLAASLGLETEVFIHGALCVAYSGQCLLSSMIGSGVAGARSGNRGLCAQPCRLPWSIGSGKGTPVQPYLSPRDQALPAYLPQLAAAGVASLKIEGRMRPAAYVGQVTAVYRELLDFKPDQGRTYADLLPVARRRLLLAFNRGGAFTDRYISGNRDTSFSSGCYPGSHGVLLGTIRKPDAASGVLFIDMRPDLPADWQPLRGDILSVRRDGANQETASAPLGEIGQRDGLLRAKGFHPDALRKMLPGDLVFRMNDRQAERAAEQSHVPKTPIRLKIWQADGQVHLLAENSDQARLSQVFSLEETRDIEAIAPVLQDRAEEQLRKTGTTAFRVHSIDLCPPISLSIASLNELRRRLLDRLAGQLPLLWHRTLPATYRGDWAEALQLACMRRGPDSTSSMDIQSSQAAYPVAGQPEPLLRSSGLLAVSAYFHQLPADLSQLACGAARYYLPIMELEDDLAQTCQKALREREADCRILAWLPAAATGSAADLLAKKLQQLRSWGFDGIASGSPGADLQIPLLPTQPPAGTANLTYEADTGANVFNQAALLYFGENGCDAVAPSLELSENRLRPLAALANRVGLPLEVALYGRLRVMTSAFCPIGQNLPGCALCGRERPTAIRSIQDQRSAAFPLVTHPGPCYVELYSQFLYCIPQEWARLYSGKLRPRLYFLEETPEERQRLVSLASRLPEGSASAFTQTARLIADRLGSTLGQGHINHDI